ncbi:unnamed protein product, partial [Rotaria sp. Silwood2]
MGQTPSTTDITTTTDAPSSVSSEFYLACRNGEAKKVKRMLPQMNTADINSRTPNGSTSLHDASFYGHKTIVKMLLANGAQPWIINKYKNMPYEEATNDEIRSLFLRPLERNNNRFFYDDPVSMCLELISEKKIEENATNNVPNGWINGYKNIGRDIH